MLDDALHRFVTHCFNIAENSRHFLRSALSSFTFNAIRAMITPMNNGDTIPPDQIRRTRRRISHRFAITLLTMIGLLIIGVSGYRLLEGMNFVDALYMTITTITTVGFGEVQPLSPLGRLFTIGLIIAGVSIAAYALGSVAQFVVSGDWQIYLQERRRRNMLEQLKEHIIVCGYGRVGKSVVHQLCAEKLQFVVIESEAERVAHLRDLGHLALHGNAANEELLRTAGIDRARGLVACAGTDAENVYIVLTARGLRPDLSIVARANYEESESKLLRAGATRVMLPSNIAGRRMVTMLVRPEVSDYLDVISHASDLELLVEQISIAETSVLANKMLAEAELGPRWGITVLACAAQGRLNLRPGADTVIEPGIRLIVLGTRDQLQELMAAAV
jgi:voltage-gated potassium channel